MNILLYVCIRQQTPGGLGRMLLLVVVCCCDIYQNSYQLHHSTSTQLPSDFRNRQVAKQRWCGSHVSCEHSALIFNSCLLCPVPGPNLWSDEELTTNETETLTSVLFRVILFSLLRVIVKEILAVSALLSQENIRCGPRSEDTTSRLVSAAALELRTHIYCYRVYSKPTHFNIPPGAGRWAGLGNIHYAGYPPAGAWAGLGRQFNLFWWKSEYSGRRQCSVIVTSHGTQPSAENFNFLDVTCHSALSADRASSWMRGDERFHGIN